MIQLAGNKPSDHPDAVKNIALHHKGGKNNFLHGTAGSIEEDILIGSYVFHCANGETWKIPLVHGRNTQNSFDGNREDILTDAVTTWTNETTQVFKYTAYNPLSDIEVKTMDFISNDMTIGSIVQVII